MSSDLPITDFDCQNSSGWRQIILAGNRNLALATDTNLDYDDAVELQLLLERLG